MKSRAHVLPLLLALFLSAFGCGEGYRAKRAVERAPRIVLVTFDTMHVGWTGVYGGTDHTPELDRLTAAGVVFEHGYTTVPITLPAHTAILSGRSPIANRVLVNGDEVPDEIVTLPEILGPLGYRTAAFVSLGVLQENANLDQGFDQYDDFDEIRETRRWYRTADEVVASFSRWLDEVGEGPFFAWVHLSDPHEPYLAVGAAPDVVLELDGVELGRFVLEAKERQTVELTLEPGEHEVVWRSLREPAPDDHAETGLYLELGGESGLEAWLPEGVEIEPDRRIDGVLAIPLANPGEEPVRVSFGFRGRLQRPPESWVLDQYPREVAFADRQLGAIRSLLEERGLFAGTLWALLSDHGEGLYRHGNLGHASQVYDDQLRILWSLVGPGIPAGVRVAAQPVLNEDLAPTLLDHLGLRAPKAMTGRSLSGCWSGGKCPERVEWSAYGVNQTEDEVASVARYEWPEKALLRGHRGVEAYDVVADPDESANLLVALPPRDRRPRQGQLTSELATARAAVQAAYESRSMKELSAADLEMLESLGYLNQ